MKIIKNKLIPFRGYSAMMFLGVLWTRKHALSPSTVLHESIHAKQEKELLYLGFWFWYLLEYLFRLIQYRNHWAAYKNISFEREAYENEKYEHYLAYRNRFEFLKYLRR